MTKKSPRLALVATPPDNDADRIIVLTQRVRGIIEMLICAQTAGDLEPANMLSESGLAGALFAALENVEAIEALAAAPAPQSARVAS